MADWKFLSYPVNDKAFGYGNGERFKLSEPRNMCNGDTSNNSTFTSPTHYGTHIDFPYHFGIDGKKSSDYKADDFVFNSPSIIGLNGIVDDYLIRNSNLNISSLNPETDILFIKTGFCEKRYTDEYWERGYGFHSETAGFLANNLPKLKAIAFDLISLNSYQQRPEGRKAHKQFLLENDILIIEEVDLNNITEQTKLRQVIVSPYHIENCDGAPVTIFANTYD